jgi:hypothetical protein
MNGNKNLEKTKKQHRTEIPSCGTEFTALEEKQINY